LIDVNKVIEDIIHIAKPSLFAPSGQSLAFRPATDLPKIITSPDALKQVMINLIKNASEAIDTGGYVEITTRMFSKDSHASHVSRQPGIEIVIADSGPGLPEAIVENLYKPFVTTKKNGHSGLGLSIVNKTVNDIRGDITFMNKPGEGTIFTIYLPLDINSFH
jgi:signal transduction histidine kinase